MRKNKVLIKDKVDIRENLIKDIDPELLAILLTDQTRVYAKKNWITETIWTTQHIIWATDNYEKRWNWYMFSDWINIDKITWKIEWYIIKPRITKSLEEQRKRSEEKAEVFTPAWICNMQNNSVDEKRFWKKNIFNKEIDDKKWIVNKNKITFPNKKWKDRKSYIKDLRLEISCWEAPYMVSRYDATTWEILNVNDRIWFLDRKIRIINENAITDNERLEQVIIAFKSSYWYEWQWDSLLIARENLLRSFIDYYYYRFNKNPSLELMKKIAKIISRNVRQMDWLTWLIPTKKKYVDTLFWPQPISEWEEIECVITDWEYPNKKITFNSLLRNEHNK